MGFRLQAEDHKESLRLKNMQIEAHAKLNADLSTETKYCVKLFCLPSNFNAIKVDRNSNCELRSCSDPSSKSVIEGSRLFNYTAVQRKHFIG